MLDGRLVFAERGERAAIKPVDARARLGKLAVHFGIDRGKLVFRQQTPADARLIGDHHADETGAAQLLERSRRAWQQLHLLRAG